MLRIFRLIIKLLKIDIKNKTLDSNMCIKNILWNILINKFFDLIYLMKWQLINYYLLEINLKLNVSFIFINKIFNKNWLL